jgi:hypothetical protein
MNDETYTARKARQRREVAERARTWRGRLRENRRPDGRACDWALSAAFVLELDETAEAMPRPDRREARISGLSVLRRAIALLVARGHDRRETMSALLSRVKRHETVSSDWDDRLPTP